MRIKKVCLFSQSYSFNVKLLIHKQASVFFRSKMFLVCRRFLLFALSLSVFAPLNGAVWNARNILHTATCIMLKMCCGETWESIILSSKQSLRHPARSQQNINFNSRQQTAAGCVLWEEALEYEHWATRVSQKKQTWKYFLNFYPIRKAFENISSSMDGIWDFFIV